MSTLGYAVLELLARQPMTGYEISRRMRKPVGYMWTSTHSAVYGALAGLESSGAVRAKVVDGRGPRDTKRYSITARGRRDLQTWVTSPRKRLPVRNELMLRVRSLWLISPDRARRLLEEVLAEGEQQLAVYEAEERSFASQGLDVTDPGQPAFGAYATVQAGLISQAAHLEWCRWLLDRLATGEREAVSQVGARSRPR